MVGMRIHPVLTKKARVLQPAFIKHHIQRTFRSDLCENNIPQDPGFSKQGSYYSGCLFLFAADNQCGRSRYRQHRQVWQRRQQEIAHIREKFPCLM